ncbi:MAG: hypothetical protein QW714_00570 [Nanopusillaceae archaeon]
MYKINKLCGINDYSVIFDEKLDIDKVSNFFVKRNYEILEKDQEIARMYYNDKKVLIYYYGEIIFINFNEEEVKNICDEIEKILKEKN